MRLTHLFRLWLVAAGLSLGLACSGGERPEVPAPPTPPAASDDGGPPPSPTPAVPARSAEVVPGDALRIPYILWGGDIAAFHGNGGLRTTRGSVFDQAGVVAELYDGNDFESQLKAYRSGESPFLRGTFRMIGLAAEEFAGDPGARPLVFLQLTWSAGDHLIAREGLGTLADLKGKTVAIQKDGPHVGMLDDVLRSSNLSWDDITVVWADAITGPGSPPERFRSDPSIDAAFAITPDMLGLTGGLNATGSGAEGTVKGSRVLVSTAELSRSIADVWAVRADFWKSDPQAVERFTNAYLRSVEELVALKNDYEAKGSDRYMATLQLAQDIFGADAVPTLEEDVHGLLMDCSFVGHPGNVAFFTDERNLTGFDVFSERSMDLAVSQGYATQRVPVGRSPIDWSSAAITQGLSKTDIDRGERFKAEAVLSEVESMDADGVLDSRTLLSFTIAFEPNQTVFDASDYRAEFDRLEELAARYGNAAVVIRGHSDTTLVLRDAVKAGLENGKLRRAGTSGDYKYFLDGRPLDIEDVGAITTAIQTSDAFRPVNGIDPRRTMQAALNLSRERAQAVRRSVLDDAIARGVSIDPSQIQAQGVGIREPLVARPRNQEEAAVNMRVEFRLVRVSAEAMTDADFDF